MFKKSKKAKNIAKFMATVLVLYQVVFLLPKFFVSADFINPPEVYKNPHGNGFQVNIESHNQHVTNNYSTYNKVFRSESELDCGNLGNAQEMITNADDMVTTDTEVLPRHKYFYTNCRFIDKDGILVSVAQSESVPVTDYSDLSIEFISPVIDDYIIGDVINFEAVSNYSISDIDFDNINVFYGHVEYEIVDLNNQSSLMSGFFDRVIDKTYAYEFITSELGVGRYKIVIKADINHEYMNTDFFEFVVKDASSATSVTPVDTDILAAEEVADEVVTTNEEAANSANVKSIKLEGDDENISWIVDGYSPSGFYIVWSSVSEPVYPNHNGGQKYFSGPENNSFTVNSLTEGVIYYVRVCEYIGSECGVYSNEIRISLAKSETTTPEVTPETVLSLETEKDIIEATKTLSFITADLRQIDEDIAVFDVKLDNRAKSVSVHINNEIILLKEVQYNKWRASYSISGFKTGTYQARVVAEDNSHKIDIDKSLDIIKKPVVTINKDININKTQEQVNQNDLIVDNVVVGDNEEEKEVKVEMEKKVIKNMREEVKAKKEEERNKKDVETAKKKEVETAKKKEVEVVKKKEVGIVDKKETEATKKDEVADDDFDFMIKCQDFGIEDKDDCKKYFNETPEVCVKNKIIDKHKCNTFIYQKTMPQVCREKKAVTQKECSWIMMMNDLPSVCVDAQVATRKECDDILNKTKRVKEKKEVRVVKKQDKKTQKNLLLNKKCLLRGIKSDEMCQMFLNNINLPEECLSNNIFDADECDEYIFDKMGSSECREVGIYNKEECEDYMVNKVMEKAVCSDELGKYVCQKNIKENYLSAVVAKRVKYQELRDVKKEVENKTVEVARLKDKLKMAKTIISVRNAKTKVKMLDSKEEMIVSSQGKWVQSSPVIMVLDKDGDGLIDSIEKSIGTNIEKADTDGDGYSDYEEYINKYNPLGSGKLTRKKELAPVEKAILDNRVIEQPLVSGQESDDFVVEEKIENTQDKEGAGYIFQGIAAPNTVVTLYIYSDLPLMITVSTGDNGNWKYNLKESLTDGTHEVYVALNDETGKIIAKSSALSFLVNEAKAATLKDIVSNKKVVSTMEKEEADLFIYYIIATSVLISVSILIFLYIAIRKKNEV